VTVNIDSAGLSNNAKWQPNPFDQGRQFSYGRDRQLQTTDAQRLQQRRGLTGTLYLGVRKDEANFLSAHASWRSGGDILVGGENQPDFGGVATFGAR
jgi:hypothetical protein